MTNLGTNANASIDPSTPFCARTYYTGLRYRGANPCVCQASDGRLGESHTIGSHNGVGDVDHLYAWAESGDADRSLRREYALAAWDARTSEDDKVVPLGVLQ